MKSKGETRERGCDRAVGAQDKDRVAFRMGVCVTQTKHRDLRDGKETLECQGSGPPSYTAENRVSMDTGRITLGFTSYCYFFAFTFLPLVFHLHFLKAKTKQKITVWWRMKTEWSFLPSKLPRGRTDICRKRLGSWLREPRDLLDLGI